MNFLQSIYLSHFSYPIENRPIYQAVKKIQPRTVVELGIQRGTRTANLLELAVRYHEPSSIQYYCVDPFEGRSVEDGPGLSIRKAHKMLTKFGVKTKAIPCDAPDGIRQILKGVRNIDLMVVATPSLEWISDKIPFVAEILSEKGIVFLGQSTPDGKPFLFRRLSLKEFQSQAIPLRKVG